MGLLKSLKRRSEERRAQHARAENETALKAWQAEDDALNGYLTEAKTLNGYTKTDDPSISIQLKKDERVFIGLRGAVLIEPKRGPGHWQGGYSGVSFRVYKGIRLHTGGTRGTYMQGEETPTPVDTGIATITNQRIVFEGSKQAREWSYAKLLDEEHSPTLPWTSLPVSNRQKISGILYDQEHSEQIRFRMALALAHYNNDVASLVSQIENEIKAHQAAKPVLPATLGTAEQPALPPAAASGDGVASAQQRRCPNGHPVAPDARFCPECGATL
ncbi:MAG: zinc ribbon domain-containing protein [Gaiellaceae bacterium]